MQRRAPARTKKDAAQAAEWERKRDAVREELQQFLEHLLQAIREGHP